LVGFQSDDLAAIILSKVGKLAGRIYVVSTRKLVVFLLLSALSASGLSAGAGELYDSKYKGRLVKGEWEHPWTNVMDEGLNLSPLLQHKEHQIETMCPGYNASEAKRRTFWRQLFISLSWRESLHGPRNYVQFNGGVNNGLYQINPVLRRAYDCDGFDLFNASQNIRCAVKMATKLVARFGAFLKGPKGGMAAYWQPLRATNAYNRKNREFILKHVREACRTGVLAYHAIADFYPADEDWAQEADSSFNTIEDLGLSEDQLDPIDDNGRDYDPITFMLNDLVPAQQ
jgi:hypothetical protein